jgi:hypothetical protein
MIVYDKDLGWQLSCSSKQTKLCGKRGDGNKL